MNKLEWRLAFAKQYAKRRGDFLMGWILSRTEVELYRMGQAIEWGLKNKKPVNFFNNGESLMTVRCDRMGEYDFKPRFPKLKPTSILKKEFGGPATYYSGEKLGRIF